MAIKVKKGLSALVYVIFACSSPLFAQTLTAAHPPKYPLAAMAAGIDGPVVLKGTITKAGKVTNLHVLSGAPELQQAAIDAVQSWTYKPYTDEGRAVDVDTTVTVNFDMGRGKKKAAAQAKAQAELAKPSQQQSGAAASPVYGTATIT